MRRFILPAAFAAIVFCMLAAMLLRAPAEFTKTLLLDLGRPPEFARDLDNYCKNYLPFRQQLRDLSLTVRTAAGMRELNGMYLTNDRLISHFIPSSDGMILKDNTKAVKEFAKHNTAATALMLLPTASAICQEELPPYAAEIQANQHGYIERAAKALSGVAASVDVYPTLFAAREEYLYYRTDNDLTAHGGYLVYTVLARRLGFSPTPKESFRQQFLEQPYYGDLYRAHGYGGVRGDTIAVYRPESSPTVTVEHWLRFQQKSYSTLFPVQATASGNPRDIIMGGHSPKITVTNLSLPSGPTLLILGDRNTLSYLPFLTSHYRSITFADPDLLTDSELQAIQPDDYSQLLFSFSLESFVNTRQPARAAKAGTVQ
ncbi:MAG: DHHW family protein [Angelakisella sp.]